MNTGAAIHPGTTVPARAAKGIGWPCALSAAGHLLVILACVASGRGAEGSAPLPYAIEVFIAEAAAPPSAPEGVSASFAAAGGLRESEETAGGEAVAISPAAAPAPPVAVAPGRSPAAAAEAGAVSLPTGPPDGPTRPTPVPPAVTPVPRVTVAAPVPGQVAASSPKDGSGIGGAPGAADGGRVNPADGERGGGQGPAAGRETTAGALRGVPSPGAGAGTEAGRGSGRGFAALRGAIQSRIVYPEDAIRRGQEGLVLLRIRVGEDGLPGEIRVTMSSGTRSLDDAARRGVLRAAPLPSEPGWVDVPVLFRLR